MAFQGEKRSESQKSVLGLDVRMTYKRRDILHVPGTQRVFPVHVSELRCLHLRRSACSAPNPISHGLAPVRKF